MAEADNVTGIEAGYVFYNANEDEFKRKEFTPDRIAAVSFAAGMEAGRHELKEKVIKEFKPCKGNWE